MIHNSHNFDDVSEKIEDLEDKLEDLVQCLAQGYYPTKLVSAVRVTRALELKKIPTLKVSVEELIDVYNNVPHILSNSAATVSVATADISRAEITLEKSTRGNYWVIATEQASQKYWLLPNGEIEYQNLYKKLFNKYSINTIRKLFEYDDLELSADKHLIIEQPAQVKFIPNGQKWKLEQLGKIEFGINSRLYQLKTLEHINQQHQQLKLYVNKLQSEITQLKASLDKSQIERKTIEQQINLLSEQITQNSIRQIENSESDFFIPQSSQPSEPTSDSQTNKTLETYTWQKAQLVHELEGHTSTVRTVAIANWQEKNEKQIVISGGYDKTIRIWNLNTGELIKTLDSKSRVNAISITPDSKSFISGGDDGKIEIWDIATANHRTIDAHAHRILAMVVSSDGKTIYSGSRDHSIKPWNYDSGQVRWNHYDGQIRDSFIGDYGTVVALDISSTNEFLASSTGDNIVRLWKLDPYELLEINFQHSDLVWSLAISPDQKTLVCGCRDNTIKIWDIETGEQKYNLCEHAAEIWAVAISPDGRTLASGSGDHTIKLWNLQTGELLHNIESHLNAVYALAFSSDGKFLVSASKDEIVKVWQPSA
ncbi:MAG: hypothetical protein AAGF26_07535 [Cyanobacteria bacterium P01_G01_bin.49]